MESVVLKIAVSTRDNLKTAKRKAMDFSSTVIPVESTLASLKTAKCMGTAHAGGSLKKDEFIVDNGMKTRKKDTDSRRSQVQSSMMENLKTEKCQE
jgi:hypothetical protein